MHPERPLPLAIEPPPRLTPRARRAIVVLVLVFVGGPTAFAGAALLGRFVIHGPVDAGSLAYSVGHANGALSDVLGGGSTCRPTGRARTWTCRVADPALSGPGATYRVVVEPDGSCWTARRTRSEAGAPHWRPRADGCVRARQWTMADEVEEVWPS